VTDGDSNHAQPLGTRRLHTHGVGPHRHKKSPSPFHGRVITTLDSSSIATATQPLAVCRRTGQSTAAGLPDCNAVLWHAERMPARLAFTSTATKGPVAHHPLLMLITHAGRPVVALHPDEQRQPRTPNRQQQPAPGDSHHPARAVSASATPGPCAAVVVTGQQVVRCFNWAMPNCPAPFPQDPLLSSNKPANKCLQPCNLCKQLIR
jgi:hypothetical protein